MKVEPALAEESTWLLQQRPRKMETRGDKLVSRLGVCPRPKLPAKKLKVVALPFQLLDYQSLPGRLQPGERKRASLGTFYRMRCLNPGSERKKRKGLSRSSDRLA